MSQGYVHSPPAGYPQQSKKVSMYSRQPIPSTFSFAPPSRDSTRSEVSIIPSEDPVSGREKKPERLSASFVKKKVSKPKGDKKGAPWKIIVLIGVIVIIAGAAVVGLGGYGTLIDPDAAINVVPTASPSFAPSAAPTQAPQILPAFPVEERAVDEFIGLSALSFIDNEVASAIVAATARWNSIVSQTLPNVLGGLVPPQVNDGSFCGLSFPEAIILDHLFLVFEVIQIDGIGGVTAISGPCAITNFPVLGLITLDEADAVEALDAGVLEHVAFHEIAHALGFGTVWKISVQGAINAAGIAIVQNTIFDANNNFISADRQPFFIGQAASETFTNLTNVTPLPVEDGTTAGLELFAVRQNSLGTADLHWDEDFFIGEIMSFRILEQFSPPLLSTVTIASMQDLGYVVNFDEADEEFQFRFVQPAARLRGRNRVFDLSNDIRTDPITFL